MRPHRGSCFVPLLILSACVCACTSDQLLLHMSCASGSDCSIQCPAEPQPGTPFRNVTWYLVRASSSSGTWSSSSSRSNSSTEQEALTHQEVHVVLHDIKCSDAGVYMCQLTAPEDGVSTEGHVLLTVTGCPNENIMIDVILVSVLLILALLTFLISYVSLKSASKDGKTLKKDIAKNQDLVLDLFSTPPDQKDLKAVFTLGPKPSNNKHVWV